MRSNDERSVEHVLANDKVSGDYVEAAVDQVGRWLTRARSSADRDEQATTRQLAAVIDDDGGVAFAMRFSDRVMRPPDNGTAAHQLHQLVRQQDLPDFLSPLDRMLLSVGARLAPRLPGVVMPLARRRLRQLVGHLVVDADDAALAAHLGQRRAQSFRLNVNPLGEAVLGRSEADRRLAEAIELLGRPDVDYVSVKVSSLVDQLNPWAFDESVALVVAQLTTLFAAAAATDPATFVNLDMEEYRDLELTIAAFTQVLSEPRFAHLDAGIVLQAYLPDALGALEQLVEWATKRRAGAFGDGPGGVIKIRLVKGANLAMERVEAAMHGWDQAPYETKAGTDANYKRCLDWVLRPEHLDGIRVGVASHNLFDLAWADVMAAERGVRDSVTFEMLEGVAPSLARVVNDEATPDSELVLYTPVVEPENFDVALAYLFRRLEENAASDNFIRHLFELEVGSAAFAAEEAKFRAAVASRDAAELGPRRQQDRTAPYPSRQPVGFTNEPDTDPALPANRRWAAAAVADAAGSPVVPNTAITTDTGAVDAAVAAVSSGSWAAVAPHQRRRILHGVADELARRRGELVTAMVGEARKTIDQADVEVSEAVDFARWYAEAALDLTSPVARFEPLGVIGVVPPWNFPVAIVAGGILGALAAGNAVVAKPAPETPRCAELVVEACWAGGVPRDALAFIRTPDDHVGRHLISHPGIDAIILTGAYETAELFRSWRPDLRLFAETSGKNALVITANADIDDAVADLVASAFGHAGQKCSAASLAILVGPVARSERFRRQLADAVESIKVGPATEVSTTMGPLIGPASGKLDRGLRELDPGEAWLVEPRYLGHDTWTPGVRTGVRPNSWFHQTECFGPILGLMGADSLDDAIAMQNAVPFGLTGGIHSLDPDEVDRWLDGVEVGNAYVNRGITGAIVGRQPFGGWKRSVIGPGAKAGGPNYLRQLGRWIPADRSDADQWLESARRSDLAALAAEFGVEREMAGLFCEANVLRYRPIPALGIVGEQLDPVGAKRVRAAAELAGVDLIEGPPEQVLVEVAHVGGRVRVLDPALTDDLRAEAARSGIELVDDPVTADGRIELSHLMREQAISRTLHRHGNLIG